MILRILIFSIFFNQVGIARPANFNLLGCIKRHFKQFFNPDLEVDPLRIMGQYTLEEQIPLPINGSKLVHYFDDIEREKYQAFIDPYKGFTFRQSGKVVGAGDSGEQVFSFVYRRESDEFLFFNSELVNAPDGKIIKHSSGFAGGMLDCAGHMVIKDGKLLRLGNHSGHYYPSPDHVVLMLRDLKEKGIDISDVSIEIIQPYLEDYQFLNFSKLGISPHNLKLHSSEIRTN